MTPTLIKLHFIINIRIILRFSREKFACFLLVMCNKLHSHLLSIHKDQYTCIANGNAFTFSNVAYYHPRGIARA